MNFILDGMLGKLARWLRIIGYNTKYSTALGDSDLIKISKKENRILLTHDFSLYQQAVLKNLEAAYVEGINESERLSELAKRFNLLLDIDLEKSRCPKCNSKIQPVTKEKVTKKVMQNTFKHYNTFWECPDCYSIYWQGAHWTKIRATLEQAKKKQKEKKTKK